MNADQSRPLAVVTGGLNGIGYELAKQFVQNGYDVLIAAAEQVAKTAFAPMAGKDKVVAGFKNKAMVGINALRSE